MLGSKHIELDALHWGPNWTPASDVDFQRKLDEATASEQWVTCGNYARLQGSYFGRATAVIWLHYPFPLILWRAVKRTTRRIMTGERLFADNQETFRTGFLGRDSMLAWVITSHRRTCERYRKLFDGTEYRTLRRIELRHPKEAAALISSLKKASGSFP